MNAASFSEHGAMGKTIKVVPHFMRLHEWIALDRDLYKEEGLDPELLVDDMHDVSLHSGEPYFQRPQDKPFISNEKVCSTACEWAVLMNAGAGWVRWCPTFMALRGSRFSLRRTQKYPGLCISKMFWSVLVGWPGAIFRSLKPWNA